MRGSLPSLPVGRKFARRMWADWRRPPTRQSDADHLAEAIAWLRRAHDATDDDGVSYGYSILGGWRPSYREVSGYIAVTFFDIAAAQGDRDAFERAVRIARWTCEIQNRDGSISNPEYDPHRGIVFDTGQVLLGMVRAFEETGDEEFLDAARRAGHWLRDGMDPDGAWRRNTHLQVPHTYNARVAWAMLRLHEIDPDASILDAATRNLDWVVTQERDGLFEQCAFVPGKPPFTHTIAYTIRGLLEAATLTGNAKYRDCARAGADKMEALLGPDGFLAGQIDERGRPRASYCCLTGNCQLAIVWLKLDAPRVAKRSLDYVLRRQDLTTADVELRGAVAGSYPIWGRYAPMSAPVWATKFLLDALLLQGGSAPSDD